MKEVIEPRKLELAKAPLFSDALIDLMTKFESHQRPPIAMDCEILDAGALTHTHDARS